MKIKTLDGRSVLCEDPGCGKPAVYLFSQSSPAVLYTAYCDSHGLRFAERLRVALPKGRLDPHGRSEEANRLREGRTRRSIYQIALG